MDPGLGGCEDEGCVNVPVIGKVRGIIVLVIGKVREVIITVIGKVHGKIVTAADYSVPLLSSLRGVGVVEWYPHGAFLLPRVTAQHLPLFCHSSRPRRLHSLPLPPAAVMSTEFYWGSSCMIL